MSIPFPFEILLAAWATSMVGLIWWSTADAASLPEAATRGELYASRLNGVDFWTHVTESDLSRTAALALGHPVSPEEAPQRILASPCLDPALVAVLTPSPKTGKPRFSVSTAKRCHLSGYGYVLVTFTAAESSDPAIWDDVLRFVVYANGEIGTLVPQQQQERRQQMVSAELTAATPVAAPVAA
ncbi:MAG: hypothetical protein ACAI35_27820 [Candidatus Methylacidiphilales bacterium]|nr:hypothetical protein [Candidatus Methylacidiphilales bacterium]